MGDWTKADYSELERRALAVEKKESDTPIKPPSSNVERTCRFCGFSIRLCPTGGML